MISTLKDKLTRLLIEKKLLKEEDLSRAISVQHEQGGSLSDTLVKLGLISRNDLMIILSQELGIPPINLSRYKVDPAVIKLIPKKMAKHYHIIPISIVSDALTVAMTDPLNIFTIDGIKALTGFRINPVIAGEADIRNAIEEYYEEDATIAIEKIVEGMKQSEEIKMVEEEREEGPAAAPDMLRLVEDAPVVKVTNILLSEAVSNRASDILIEPLEKEVRVRYRIDGILHDAKHAPLSFHNAIVSRLKVISDLDIAEKRLPQDGRFKVRLHGREVDFRISVLPSSKGEKIALRILDKSQAMLDLDRLGFDRNSLDAIKAASKKPHGMILMCGPTGCGKTTTLYSILSHINAPEKNVVTVEDPIEYIIDGVNQVAARPDIGLTFASALRSILRQDPNIIMIGEIRDLETVDIAIKAALTGHLVLSTLHTTTAVGSITRLVNMGVEPFLITSSLVLIGAERLVRRICPNCKEPYKMGEDLLAKLKIRIPAGVASLYRGKGCEVCIGTGYKGRVGLIEVLTLSPKIKNLILENAQEHRIKEAARLEGMKSLRENGIARALEGLTTLDEILRVTVGEQDMDTA